MGWVFRECPSIYLSKHPPMTWCRKFCEKTAKDGILQHVILFRWFCSCHVVLLNSGLLPIPVLNCHTNSRNDRNWHLHTAAKPVSVTMLNSFEQESLPNHSSGSFRINVKLIDPQITYSKDISHFNFNFSQPCTIWKEILEFSHNTF